MLPFYRKTFTVRIEQGVGNMNCDGKLLLIDEKLKRPHGSISSSELLKWVIS